MPTLAPSERLQHRVVASADEHRGPVRVAAGGDGSDVVSVKQRAALARKEVSEYATLGVREGIHKLSRLKV